ncbi:Receptor-like serine/threonine-protein kinase SD1-6 [Raphanus sativus]|nr:Receptor-like serine/threonine-protein kinase SD1-6 [Raphanus sativus]
MKLGWDHKTGLNRYLRSWRSPDDPSSGDFSTKLETTRGFPESTRVEQRLDHLQERSVEREPTNVYSRVVLSSAGLLQRFTWFETEQSWRQLWYLPRDLCDDYRECGDYGYCDLNTSPVCNCIQGFETRRSSQEAGCVRKTGLSCDGKDGFVRLKKMKLPDTRVTVGDSGIGLKECEERCLKDCNCTAFANMDIRNGGSGCVIWNGDIFDVRNFPNGGQDLYVRLAAADLVDKRTKNGKIIGLSIGVTIILLLLCFIIFRFWKKKQKRSIAIQTPIVDQGRMEDSLMTELAITSRRYISRENKTNDDLELSLMEFEVGRLLDGKEIAVKRLSKMSLQGTDEFKNEVWRNWKEGKWLEIVDPIIIDSSSSTCQAHEILRCIQIGLLCVQERAEDRPVMASVMAMIGSETMVIPEPKRPGFCVGRNPLEIDSSSSTQGNDECTVNQITLSVVDAR